MVSTGVPLPTATGSHLDTSCQHHGLFNSVKCICSYNEITQGYEIRAHGCWKNVSLPTKMDRTCRLWNTRHGCGPPHIQLCTASSGCYGWLFLTVFQSSLEQPGKNDENTCVQYARAGKLGVLQRQLFDHSKNQKTSKQTPLEFSVRHWFEQYHWFAHAVPWTISLPPVASLFPPRTLLHLALTREPVAPPTPTFTAYTVHYQLSQSMNMHCALA